MARPGAIVNALKAVPGRGGYTPAPSISGMGQISPVQAQTFGNSYANSYAAGYGPFLERPSRVFTDAAFAPAAPILPTPIDEPPPGGTFAGPRWWQYRQAWNLPTPPGTEGLKLASFDQLRTLAQKYSVARACIELRQEEIRGLEWNITLTTEAAKAYRNDNGAMKDFGERKAKAMKFFNRPDPDFWNFSSFLNAMLEEILVYDALSVIFRPKFGATFGMGGRGLLGSDLDSIRLVSGPTIRPLIDVHGGKPEYPAPAYQQFLYGVPRSDYMTIAMGHDIDEAGLAGAEVNEFNADIMLYAPYWPTRESPYGFPPVERALLPIISGLQKQEFQLDYFTEGTVPAVYISPGDANITPTQIGELQNALNALAGDPAYHMKVIVLPPGSKVEPQRPIDLSDSFDFLVMNQVCMAFDVQPIELGILPSIGGGGDQGPSASAVRFGSQESRDIKSRKSTKPMLKYIQDIFNYVLQGICNQADMQFEFEGMVDDEDKQAITSLGVEQIQNGVASIDEVRERLDMPPWGLEETQEPIVMTQNGPIPFSQAPKLIAAMLTQGQNQQSSSSSGSKSKPKPKKGTSATKPNGTHSAPAAPSRPNPTPQHTAAQAQVRTLTPQRGSTGGTAGRTQNAGSRKRGEGMAPTQQRLRNKNAALAELDAFKRHIRKGRDPFTWEPKHITPQMVFDIAVDTVIKGYLIDVAADRALNKAYNGQWPGWEHDLGLVGRYKQEISQAFQTAEIHGREIRHKAATGQMFVPSNVLSGLISDATKGIFLDTMTPMWKSAWKLGYDAANSLISGKPFGVIDNPMADPGSAMEAFLQTEGQHWLDQVSKTGLGNSDTRSEVIARTEVSRAINAGALECYKEHGVTHKHLLIAPDDVCEVCEAAKSEGDIPLDAIFPGGNPPFHPNCRCVTAPAYVNVEPPMAHISKSAQEDPNRVAFLMIRGKDPDGKTRYLLQKRMDDTWGLPGGMAHIGEEPFDAAVRETIEEIGDIPPVSPLVEHRRYDGDKFAFVFLCEVPGCFPILMNGATPEETAGAGWFRRSEVDDLPLHPPFKKQWDAIDWKDIAKTLRNVVSPDGEWMVLDSDDRMGATGGAIWPYPQRATSSGYPVPENRRPGGGQQLGEMGATEPPHQPSSGTYTQDDKSDETEARIYPRGSKVPGGKRGRGTPAKKFPSGEELQDAHPGGGHGDTQVTGAQIVPGGNAGPRGLSKGTFDDIVGVLKAGSAPHPVVGAPKPMTPKPGAGRPITPTPFDPAEAVEQYDPENDGNVVFNLPQTGSKKLPGAKGAGGPSDYTDANPVHSEHIYNQMAKNFPPEAIQWVKRARWTGPQNVPMDRIDQQDRDKWAASHQPEKVKEFENLIRQHKGHVAPSVLVQEENNSKAFIVDGHHRALAHENLKQPVLGYVGNIHPNDRQAALETHTHQFHSGADPKNKAVGDADRGTLDSF